ncbi:MAG: molybdopterin-binding protein [Alphaproteobacteria bacterium]|nr:molybdopterin-binding protein [Alphaproteobacteria bacterium]
MTRRRRKSGGEFFREGFMSGDGESLWAGLVVIGDEVLSGRTQDVHVSWFARHLGERGIRLGEVRVIRDDPGEIGATVEALRFRYAYVFTTGGIGPTHDDRTIDAIGAALGVAVVEDELILSAFRERFGELTAERRRMSRILEGGRSVPCSLATAPAICWGNIYILAGFPRVAREQLRAVLPELRRGAVVLSESRSLMLGESRIAGPLSELSGRHPGVEIGSYPMEPEAGVYETVVVFRSVSEDLLRAAVGEFDGLQLG